MYNIGDTISLSPDYAKVVDIDGDLYLLDLFDQSDRFERRYWFHIDEIQAWVQESNALALQCA